MSIQGPEEPSATARRRGGGGGSRSSRLPGASLGTPGSRFRPAARPGPRPPGRRRGLAGWPEAGGRARRAEAAAAAAALGREEAAEGGAERFPARAAGEMASYVDNSFRQAVMKNPPKGPPQVRPVRRRRPPQSPRLPTPFAPRTRASH